MKRRTTPGITIYLSKDEYAKFEKISKRAKRSVAMQLHFLAENHIKKVERVIDLSKQEGLGI